ncbi:TonB family protein [Sandaracinus amylolyticus]|uniref:Exopolysaccharide biosynthesis domain protein n=1 Tax=Sandaracinus amylolyticus TaxID=927083 RepID=A0A0F6YJN8_9BACT|nr:TonB family protein [Sandaracinus amylolyticus]AKF08022.1 Exopolysaccharide biosynthesis domain protein [Sandaracinus amylolyticus]
MDAAPDLANERVERVGEMPDIDAEPRSRRPHGPRVTPPAPTPRERREHGEAGASIPLVLMASLGAHALLAVVLTALPASASLSLGAPMIEIEVSMPEPTIAPPEPEPEIVPEPEPEAVPEPVREQPRVAAAPRPEREPEPAAAEPPPPAPEPPSSAPPSLDEVFGEPPPPLPSLTAAGGEAGAFTVAAGSPDGAAGGVPGGRGRAVGASGVGSGNGTGAGTSGPSAEDVRRALNAYKERVRDLLARIVRYPVPASRSGIEGRVVVALRIANDGRLLSARVRTSCGYALLDDAALEAANELRQVPAPPSLVAWDSNRDLVIPVTFEITR